MYLFAAVLILLALYAAVQSNRAIENTHQIALALDNIRGKLPQEPRLQEELGYEWYEDGWPFLKDADVDDCLQFENPIPFTLRDVYSDELLVARYRSVVGSERLAFLRRLKTPNRGLPDLLIKEICKTGDTNDRIWLASHNWSIQFSKVDGQSLESVIEADPAPVVRAALFSNPDYSRLPWDLFGPKAGWQALVATQQQIARLALMRNPKLNDRFVVALMKEEAFSLGITRDEQCALISAAVRNPDLVGGSRLHGRGFWVFDGDPNSPSQEYADMWRLAYERWLDTLAAYQVFRYIQTTAPVKLEIYKKCSGEDKEWFRATILGSCEPIKDGEVLKLGWNDPAERCREIARKRIGPYASSVGVE